MKNRWNDGFSLRDAGGEIYVDEDHNLRHDVCKGFVSYLHNSGSWVYCMQCKGFVMGRTDYERLHHLRQENIKGD